MVKKNLGVLAAAQANIWFPFFKPYGRNGKKSCCLLPKKRLPDGRTLKKVPTHYIVSTSVYTRIFLLLLYRPLFQSLTHSLYPGGKVLSKDLLLNIKERRWN